MSAPTNPLLEIGSVIPFGDILPEHVRPAIHLLLAEAKSKVDAIAASSGPRTYQNTLQALEDATEKLGTSMGIVSHLESVRSQPELREAYNEVDPEVSAFFSSIPLHAGLWAALTEFESTPEAQSLSAVQTRFLRKTIDDMRRHGAGLDAEGKRRLEEISRELAELTNRYSQNLLDSTAAFELLILDEHQLSGLPESARAQARESAREKGKEGYRLTLQAPSITPALTYLEDEGIRETLHRAYQTRATQGDHDNRPLVARILDLRREEARLLGYANFADLVLEDRMAKRGAKARGFVDDLKRRTAPFFADENAALAQFRSESGDHRPMRPWDLAFWAEKLRKAKYDYDEEELRPFFALENVLTGLFEIARRLYGVSVEPKDLPKWHDKVRSYRVLDESGKELAYVYFDLFPREDKRGGAWMNGLTIGRDGEPHVGLIAANITPPIGDVPSLLLHDEVETLFHEFGHLLHHVLTEVPVRSLAGTNVAWDFVELPSQIMENWTWEREGLDLFSKHFETKETIPAPLFEKMRRARTFRAANAQFRQLAFATLDLALHTEYSESRDGDPTRYARDILEAFSPVPLPSDYAMVASFSHLFGSPVGYAAGYYSYKWAEVLDADAFGEFLRQGIFDRPTGDRFRKMILSKGDSVDPESLIREFLGREPRLDALLIRSGLVAG